MDQELVVKFTGDISGLEQSIAKADKLLNKLGTETQKLEHANKGLANSFGTILKSYLSYEAALQGGKAFLAATQQAQKYEAQLKTASGTQDQYAKNTQFLEGLAAKYNKNIIDLGGSFAKLTIATKGTNLEGAQTEKLFVAVTAASSALQLSADETNGTFNAFIQMVSKGNVQAEELRGQLGERLYGAFNLAAKAMGHSTQELNKLLETGQITASVMLPKLTEELNKTFGADAEKNAHNLGSSFDYATGQLTLFFAEAGKSSGFTDFLTESVSGVGELAKALRDLNSANPGAIGAGIKTLLSTTGLGPSMGGSAASGLGGFLGTKARGAFGWGSGTKGTPGPMFDTSQEKNVSSEDYAKQFGIRDINPAAEKKLKDAAESAANKASTAFNKWISDQIQASQDRLAERFLEIESGNQTDYKFHGVLGAVGMAQSRGISTGVDNDLNSTKQFSSDKNKSADFSKIIDGMAAVSKYRKTVEEFREVNSEMASESLVIEHVSQTLEDNLRNMYGSMAAATEAGWGEVIKKINEGKLTYEEALDGIAKSDAVEKIAEMTKQLQIDLVSGISASIGAIAAGATGMEGLMKNIYGIFGNFLMSLGKQMLVASGVFKGLKVAIATLSGPVAAIAGAAAIAAGAALKSYASSSGKSTAGSFWDGGIVPRFGGLDGVSINANGGEMILNSGQQRGLFGLIENAKNGMDFSKHGSNGRSSRGSDSGELLTSWKYDRLDLALRRGRRKNSRYE